MKTHPECVFSLGLTIYCFNFKSCLLLFPLLQINSNLLSTTRVWEQTRVRTLHQFYQRPRKEKKPNYFMHKQSPCTLLWKLHISRWLQPNYNLTRGLFIRCRDAKCDFQCQHNVCRAVNHKGLCVYVCVCVCCCVYVREYAWRVHLYCSPTGVPADMKMKEAVRL